jgi:hypothetical protein
MADTITVLDGIQFQKETTSDVWTLNGDGEQYEAVKTYAVSLPPDISGARVIFNGNYDPDGGRCHVRVKLTKITDVDPVTKTENTQSLEWTAVTPPAMQETGAIDVSGGIRNTLHIDVALSSTTASTGMEIIVQIRKEAALDEWTDLARFVGPTGTGVKSDFANQEAAAQTVLGVTNPATGHLDHVGKFIFLEDTASIAQCEIAWLVSQSGD